MEYENKVVRVQRAFFHTLPDMIENWGKEGYRIINTNQSKTFSGEEEIVIFLEREIKEKQIKTNYDRIKSMSVEEMAKAIHSSEAESCHFCSNDKCTIIEESCIQGIIKWLLQEVSDE